MPPVKSIFISIVLLTFVLPFVGAVGHAYELLDWDGYGYFFKLSAALFLCLWGVLLCRNGLVLTAKAPRYAIRTSTVIAAVTIIALFGAFPFCLCLHMFCVLGLLVLAAILRHHHHLPRWYYCLHFAASFVIVFCYMLILTALV